MGLATRLKELYDIKCEIKSAIEYLIEEDEITKEFALFPDLIVPRFISGGADHDSRFKQYYTHLGSEEIDGVLYTKWQCQYDPDLLHPVYCEVIPEVKVTSMTNFKKSDTLQIPEEGSFDGVYETDRQVMSSESLYECTLLIHIVGLDTFTVKAATYASAGTILTMNVYCDDKNKKEITSSSSNAGANKTYKTAAFTNLQYLEHTIKVTLNLSSYDTFNGWVYFEIPEQETEENAEN